MILATILALAQVPQPCPEFPMLPGTTWTYQAKVSWTVEGSATVRDTALRWTTKILASVRRDSSVIATVENWPTALAWWDPVQRPDTSLLACSEGKIYHLARSQTQDLNPLPLGVTDLIFVFPLHEGMLYAQDPPDRTDYLYGWLVEAAKAMPNELIQRGARGSDSLYTLAYRTLPDHQIVEFAAGLGITRYIYAHHGTVATADATLLSSHIAHLQ